MNRQQWLVSVTSELTHSFYLSLQEQLRETEKEIETLIFKLDNNDYTIQVEVNEDNKDVYPELQIGTYNIGIDSKLLTERDMNEPLEQERLDDEITQVIDKVEGLQSRLQKEWKKKNKRDKIKKEINEINDKIQKIFEKIIDLTDESSEKN